VLFHDAYKVDVWTGPLKLIREDILIKGNSYKLFLMVGTIVGLIKQKNTTLQLDVDILGFLNYERYKHSKTFKIFDKLLDGYMRSKYRIKL